MSDNLERSSEVLDVKYSLDFPVRRSVVTCADSFNGMFRWKTKIFYYLKILVFNFFSNRLYDF